MEKIKLNDGTVLEIKDGATEYAITVVTASVDEVAKQFTDSNLERYEILTADDSVCAIFTKKHLKKLSAEVTEAGYLVTIVLDDVNELYERVKSLEATVETLQAEIEATKEVTKETETEIDGTETETEIIEDSTNEDESIENTEEVVEESTTEPTE